MHLESIFFLLFWRWWRMSAQEKYDYLFDKNTNPTWQAWTICFVLVSWGFATWIISVNFEAIFSFWRLVWTFGAARFVLTLLLTCIVLMYSEFLRIFGWYFGCGIALGHFLNTEFLKLNGFKYFGLIFLTNLAQAAGIFLIIRTGFSDAVSAQWYIPIAFALLPLVGAIGLLMMRKYLQNKLHDLHKIAQPTDLLDVHLLDND